MATSVTIITTPASSFTYKMVPVYNGLPFVLTSNRTTRNNFKYTLDVYVGGTKITTLKQNKDISNSDRGIFDIGRIVENYIKTTVPTFTTYGYAGNVDAYKSYYVKTGCEFERYLDIKSITRYVGGTGEYTKFTFYNSDHDLRVGDYILVQGTSAYNRYGKVTNIAGNYVVTDNYWTGDEFNVGTIIEAEGFYDNAFVSGGYIGFAIPTTRPTRIKVGDRVVVWQDTFPNTTTNPGYNGEWLCTSIYTQNIGGTDYQIIATDCPYISDTPVEGGAIYSLSKVSYSELSTSTTEYAWDGGLQYVEWLSYNPTTYSMNNTYQGKFLTESPRTLKIRRDEYATLSFLNTSVMGATTKRMSVQSYDSDGLPAASTFITIGTTTNTYARVEFGSGVLNLETYPGFTLGPAVAYDMYLIDDSNNKISETIRYEIDDECYRHTQKRLKWKNRLGGWDYFTFNLRSDKTVNIERGNYRKSRNSLISNQWTYQVKDRGQSTYSVKAYDSEVLQSNWLSDAEATWLEDLFTSPDVYLMDGSNSLPVTVSNTNIVIGEKENRGLISYTISIDYAYNKVIQRG